MDKKTFVNSWAVILAGGSGTRFWPKSLQKRPKQLAKLGTHDKTMLELTLDRLDPIIPPERRLIITNQKQMELTQKIVGDSCHHFIPEPLGRNTAAALTLAALEIKHLTQASSEAMMLSFHADHIIQEEELFLKSLEESVNLATKGFLTLIGVKPTKADTAFGYIKVGEKVSESKLSNSFKVASFFEKPVKSVAESYLKEGGYFWNSGLFVWNNRVFLNEVEEKLGDTYSKLSNFYKENREKKSPFALESFERVFKSLEDISVDHAILEKSKRIAMATTSMRWMDIGSWDALPKAFPTDNDGNLVSGDALLLESRNCVVDAGDKFVATLGLEDIVVVAMENSVLVCHKDKAQEVKKVVEHLKRHDRSELL